MSIFLGCMLASILAADEPQPEPLPIAPPDGAIVLFDGRGTNQFLSMEGKEMNWPVEDGTLVSTRGQGRTNHLVSKLHFRDAEIHVEFMLPDRGREIAVSTCTATTNCRFSIRLARTSPRWTTWGRSRVLETPGQRLPETGPMADLRHPLSHPRRDDSGKIVEDGPLTRT